MRQSFSFTFSHLNSHLKIRAFRIRNVKYLLQSKHLINYKLKILTQENNQSKMAKLLLLSLCCNASQSTITIQEFKYLE